MKRYGIWYDEDYFTDPLRIIELPEGDWVRYENVAALNLEIEKAISALQSRQYSLALGHLLAAREAT